MQGIAFIADDDGVVKHCFHPGSEQRSQRDYRAGQSPFLALVTPIGHRQAQLRACLGSLACALLRGAEAIWRSSMTAWQTFRV